MRPVLLARRGVCPVCLRKARLRSVRNRGDTSAIAEMLHLTFPEWERKGGVCAACFEEFANTQQILPASLRDAQGRLLPILPTRVRLRAQTKYTGRGVTIAFLDSGFYPHQDLTSPRHRILAYHNVLDPRPASAEVRDVDVSSWHGMMTSVVCAGNGHASGGFYRGLASEANLVLVKVGTARRIKPEDILRGLRWVHENRKRYGIRIVNVSCGGDDPEPYLEDPLCQEVERLTRDGLLVVCAAGNAGSTDRPEVIPPASAPSALTVGGFNDGNRPDMSGSEPYWSSYGPTVDGLQKPDVVAPAIWIAAPILPDTKTHEQARVLNELGSLQGPELRLRILELSREHELLQELVHADPAVIRAWIASQKQQERLISGSYQHVDGTSFAAPIVTSLCALLLERNPELRPWELKRRIAETAVSLPGDRSAPTGVRCDSSASAIRQLNASQRATEAVPRSPSCPPRESAATPTRSIPRRFSSLRVR